MFVSGLNGSSLGGKPYLDSFLLLLIFGVVDESELLLENEWECVHSLLLLVI